jgi:hypothetical protein
LIRGITDADQWEKADERINGRSQMTKTKQAGDTKLIVLILVAVLLAIGYGGLDMYGEGEKYVTMTESRGIQIMQGLSKYKLAAGAYPDTVDKLAPKFIEAVPKCPAGEPFEYALSGTEFTLGCQKVAFKMRPYRYDSRTKAWRG